MRITRRPKFIIRLWESCPFHLLFLSLLTLALSLTYVYSHFKLRQKYTDSVAPLVQGALTLYRVEEDPSSHLVRLRRAEVLVEDVLKNSESPALGLEKAPAVLGLLSATAHKAMTLNRRVETHVRSSLQAFRERDGQFIRAPLAAFLRNNATVLTGEARLEIPHSTYESLVNAAPTLDTLRRLESALGGTVRRLNKPSEVSVGSNPVTTSGWIPPTVTEDLRRAASLRVTWGSPDPFSVEEAVALRAHFSTFEHESELLTKELQDSFQRIASAELGFFWIYGSWRWLEIIWWTWLGVLTQALVVTGFKVVGRSKYGPFDPRWTLRTLSSLVYVPILSVAVLWGVFHTSLMNDLAFSAGEAAASCLIAFILGLFPHLAYQKIRDVADAVFNINNNGGDEGASPARRSAPPTPPAPTVTPTAPPSVAGLVRDLKASVASLFR